MSSIILEKGYYGSNVQQYGGYVEIIDNKNQIKEIHFVVSNKDGVDSPDEGDEYMIGFYQNNDDLIDSIELENFTIHNAIINIELFLKKLNI